MDAADPREELRQLLRTDGILYAESDRPITGRDGRQAPWTLYTPAISLTGRGAELAARCLLPVLDRFESTQLAAFGYTGVPLLTACLVHGAPRYSGLLVREARKSRGTGRQVEGPIDRSRPAVVIDDSLSSGTSLRAAIGALESEGIEVEGAVCLVRFPYRGGAEWARALGYRVETVFDVWDDLQMPRPTYVPGHLRTMPEAWADVRVHDGLHPALVARFVSEHLLKDGTVPRPPRRMDGSYDGRGGVYVSFRNATNDHRVGRDGFWHFDARDADAARDVVLATVKTIRNARGAISRETLPRLKIAVSFFDPLEPIGPSSLDYAHYGLVTQSTHWPTKVGGALPDTQVFISEYEQYRHARITNGRIGPGEPHRLYRHRVVKCPEPGAYWLPFGASRDDTADWSASSDIGRRLTERARAMLLNADDIPMSPDDTQAKPVADDLIPAPVSAIAATLYAHGAAGCGVAWHRGSLDDTLRRAVEFARADRRFGAIRGDRRLAELDLTISVLHDREWLGTTTAERVARKLRPGRDAFSVHQGDHHGVLLECVIPYYNWSREEAVRRLLTKAGIGDGLAAWATYRTATWLAGPDGLLPLRFGYPRRESLPAGDWPSSAARMAAGYIHRSLADDGLPAYRREPVTGTQVVEGPAARRLHASAAMGDAGHTLRRPAWTAAALKGIGRALDAADPGPPGTWPMSGPHGSPMASFQLLSAAVGAGLPLTGPVERLARSLRPMFLADGRIAAPGDVARLRQDHDYLPGVAILAFAQAARRSRSTLFRPDYRLHLGWYRRRFRLMATWGLTGWGLAAWHMQAWSAVHDVELDPAYSAFVFELADWAVERQLEVNGAFLTDLSGAGPSFHTAFVAEGIADAWRLAAVIGDDERAGRYARSWRRAMAFMRELTILPEDTFCMRLGEDAIGGVRPSQTASEVRVDYVSHTLTALIKGMRAADLEAVRPGDRSRTFVRGALQGAASARSGSGDGPGER
jgi:orotate phosphoribosyltransferase